MIFTCVKIQRERKRDYYRKRKRDFKAAGEGKISENRQKAEKWQFESPLEPPPQDRFSLTGAILKVRGGAGALNYGWEKNVKINSHLFENETRFRNSEPSRSHLFTLSLRYK